MHKILLHTYSCSGIAPRPGRILVVKIVCNRDYCVGENWKGQQGFRFRDSHAVWTAGSGRGLEIEGLQRGSEYRPEL